MTKHSKEYTKEEIFNIILTTLADQGDIPRDAKNFTMVIDKRDGATHISWETK